MQTSLLKEKKKRGRPPKIHKIYSDGYTIGSNPSYKGGGFIVTDDKQEVLAKCITIPTNSRPTTNNETELMGIQMATIVAKKHSEIYSDSYSAIAWVKRGCCKARPDLSYRAKEAKDNIKDKKLKLIQIPREINQAGIWIEEHNLDWI